MSVVKKSYKPDQVIFKEGEPPNAIFIIARGAISIRKAQGQEYIEVAKVHSGEIIGEMSFFDRLPRSASAVAINDVDVLEISFESMEKIYASMPSYMRAIVASLADRLRKANDTIRQLQQKNKSQ